MSGDDLSCSTAGGIVGGAAHKKVLNSGATEICVKTASEGWVVGRMSNGRELFVISENKTSNLVEVSDEVQRISSSYFSNIFI